MPDHLPSLQLMILLLTSNHDYEKALDVTDQATITNLQNNWDQISANISSENHCLKNIQYLSILVSTFESRLVFAFGYKLSVLMYCLELEMRPQLADTWWGSEWQTSSVFKWREAIPVLKRPGFLMDPKTGLKAQFFRSFRFKMVSQMSENQTCSPAFRYVGSVFECLESENWYNKSLVLGCAGFRSPLLLT